MLQVVSSNLRTNINQTQQNYIKASHKAIGRTDMPTSYCPDADQYTQMKRIEIILV